MPHHAVPPGQSDPRAAVGFRVHSGWTAFVAVTLDGNGLKFLARGRPHLVESFTYKFRQPYHTAETMPRDKAGAFISSAEREALSLARSAIQSLQTALHKEGYELGVLALIRSSGRPLPELDKILGSHALIHSADGELFRRCLAQAARNCGLEEFDIKEKDLMETTSKVLGLTPTLLNQKITCLGKPIGAPWSQDEKFAAMAAWLALRESMETGGR